MRKAFLGLVLAAVIAITGGVAAPASATVDPLSISNVQFTRNQVSGTATWSAHVDVSGLTWASCPSYNCKISILAVGNQGGYLLAQFDILSMASSAYDKSGTFSTWTSIQGLKATWGQAQSGLANVSDSVPAKGLSLSAFSIARNQSTGSVSWSGVGLVSTISPCYGCQLQLVGVAPGGSGYVLQQLTITNYYSNTIPFSGSYNSAIPLSSVYLKYASGPELVTSAPTAFDLPMRGHALRVIVEKVSSIPSSPGSVSWKFRVVGGLVDLNYVDCPTYNCSLTLTVKDGAGSTYLIDSRALPSRYYTDYVVSGNYSGNPMVAVKATYGNATSGWVAIGSTSIANGHDYAAAAGMLVAYAGQNVSAAEACTIMFPVGTHAQGSSLSDQDLSCKALVLAGGATLTAIVLSVLQTNGVDYLETLLATVGLASAQATRDPLVDYGDPPAGCVYINMYALSCAGTTVVPYSAPVASDPIAETNAVALDDVLPVETTGEVPEIEPFKSATLAARTAFSRRVCIQYLNAADPTSGLSLAQRAGVTTEKCKSLPVFISGGGASLEATQHDFGVVALAHPEYVLLNYASAAEKAADPGAPQKPNGTDPIACGTTYDTGTQDCDEFPFYSTEQGFPLPPDYLPISLSSNRSQGSSLGRFNTACFAGTARGSLDRLYVFVPVPVATIPTYWTCNG